MQKWEYLIVDERNGDFGAIGEADTEVAGRELNKLGELGWELTSVSYDGRGLIHRAIFKRPIGVSEVVWNLERIRESAAGSFKSQETRIKLPPIT